MDCMYGWTLARSLHMCVCMYGVCVCVCVRDFSLLLARSVHMCVRVDGLYVWSDCCWPEAYTCVYVWCVCTGFLVAVGQKRTRVYVWCMCTLMLVT